MKLLVSSCARLFKTSDGTYYTTIVYDYNFYKRYLEVFDEVRVLGFCDLIDEEKAKSMIKVSGPRLSVYEVPYPHGEWDYIAKRLRIKHALKNATTGCDAVLLRIPETLCFLMMTRALKEKIPVAVEVVADPVNLYQKGLCLSKYRLVYKYYYTYMQSMSCKKANGVSFVTQYGLQSRYATAKADESHFSTFYTDTEIHVNKNREPRTLKTREPLLIIHVATHINGYAKGHKETVGAFIKLRKQGIDAKLALIGEGKLENSIENRIIGEGMKDKVILLGKMPFFEVMKWMEKADLFLFPSYNEGLPRVVVEAISLGLPVVASDIPAHRELVDAKYLAPVYDEDRLAAIAACLFSDSEQYQEASRANLLKACEYDFDTIVEKRNEFYSRLRCLAEKWNR